MKSREISHQDEAGHDDDDYVVEMIPAGDRDAESGGLGVAHERMLAFLQELAGGNHNAPMPEPTIRY
jgi:hypothetical protein